MPVKVKVFNGGSAGDEPEIQNVINEWLEGCNVEVVSIDIAGLPIDTSETDSGVEFARRLDRPAIAVLVYREL